MEIKDLEDKIFKDLIRNGSFNKVLDTENEVVLLHQSSAHLIRFTKNQDGLYNANFSRHALEIGQLLEQYKDVNK